MRPAFMSFRPDGMLREVSRFGERHLRLRLQRSCRSAGGNPHDARRGKMPPEFQGIQMTDKGDPAAEMQAIFQEEWEAHLQDDPFFATVTGDTRYNDRLPEASEAQAERQAQRLRGFLSRLERIDRQRLSAKDRLNLDVFRRLKQDALAELEFRVYRMPVSRMGGFHTFFADLSTFVRFQSPKDYEDYLARLAGYSAYCEGEIGLMREGLRSGMTQPRPALDGTQNSIAAFITDDPAQNPLRSEER